MFTRVLRHLGARLSPIPSAATSCRRSLHLLARKRSLLCSLSAQHRTSKTTLDQYDLFADSTTPVELTFVKSHRQNGFTINDIRMWGSVITFPTFTLLWDATTLKDVTPESLTAITLTKPKTELLLIGTGAKHDRLPEALRQWSEQHGIAIDIMATVPALQTFNFLVQEGRHVAAALLTIGGYDRAENDQMMAAENVPRADYNRPPQAEKQNVEKAVEDPWVVEEDKPEKVTIQ